MQRLLDMPFFKGVCTLFFFFLHCKKVEDEEGRRRQKERAENISLAHLDLGRLTRRLRRKTRRLKRETTLQRLRQNFT